MKKIEREKKRKSQTIYWEKSLSWVIYTYAKESPYLCITRPGSHCAKITRHEAACILWDAWRKGKGATA
jgi:hypothetical protein